MSGTAGFTATAIPGQVTVQDFGSDTPFLETGGALLTISGGPSGGIPSSMPASLITTWVPSCSCAETTFTSLLPGTYTIGVMSPSNGYQNPTFSVSKMTTETVVVSPGATTTVAMNEDYLTGQIPVDIFYNEALSGSSGTATVTVNGPVTSPSVTTLSVTCSSSTPYGTPCTAAEPNLEPGIYTVLETSPPGTDVLWGDAITGDPQQVLVYPWATYPTTTEFYNLVE